VLGLGLAGATAALGGLAGDALDERQAGFAARLAVRVLWCLGLQVPWCALGSCLAGAPRQPTGTRGAAVVAGLVAVALPAVYAVALGDAQAEKVEDWLQRLRLARARPLVAGLCDLGSGRPLLGKPPRALRPELEAALRGYAAAVERPLPEAAPPAARQARARTLAVLGRLDEAERLLAPLAETDAEAALLRAAVLQDQERWEESSATYRRGLDLLADAGPAAVAGRVRAYDGLAFNARGRKAYAEAEAAYAEALERLPEARAHFHFQLGRHYKEGGRPGKALEHLQTAASLDPAGYGDRARPLIAELRHHTPGCLLRGP
jgi:tetratricopeptide (TPR) repeat protein